MSQNGIRKATAEDREHGVAQDHLSTWCSSKITYQQCV